MKSLRTLREAKGLTQAQLANAVGVAPSSVYNWERGKFEPRASQLRELARVLGVRMDEIDFLTAAGKPQRVIKGPSRLGQS